MDSVLNLNERAFPLVALVGFALFAITATGLIMGGGSIAAAAGKYLAPRTKRPAILLAARRLISAPYTSARATTSVVLAVFIGSFVQGIRQSFTVNTDPLDTDTFYADTFDLLNIVLIIAMVLSAASLLITTSESVIERRRTLAALNAAGTPRSTLARSLFAETLIPLVPSVIAAAVAGLLAARGLFGTRVQVFVGDGSARKWIDLPVPLAQIATLAISAIVVAVLTASASFIALRQSLSISELRTAA